MKIAAALEYCGTGFNGWQRLKEDRSVQQCVEEALSVVANHPVRVICAGRTDAGVHARYQVIHFETEARREDHSWVFGGNTNLPHDVCILWAGPVSDEFHARFSAISRSYEYIILNRPARPGLYHPLVAWEYRPLSVTRMNEAAGFLAGRRDFTSFRARACQSRNPVREVHQVEVERYGSYVIIRIRANAFLYHMVRNIAGALIAVGSGQREPDWVGQVLEARDRAAAAMTAAPQGLYLSNVAYPERYGIPAAGADFSLPGGRFRTHSPDTNPVRGVRPAS